MCSISHKIFEHIRKVLNANLKEFAILIAEIAKKGSKNTPDTINEYFH